VGVHIATAVGAQLEPAKEADHYVVGEFQTGTALPHLSSQCPQVFRKGEEL
jgi:hypothetical protein